MRLKRLPRRMTEGMWERKHKNRRPLTEIDAKTGLRREKVERNFRGDRILYRRELRRDMSEYEKREELDNGRMLSDLDEAPAREHLLEEDAYYGENSDQFFEEGYDEGQEDSEDERQLQGDDTVFLPNLCADLVSDYEAFGYLHEYMLGTDSETGRVTNNCVRDL